MGYFVDFLHVVVYMLNIHESIKMSDFGLAFSGKGSQLIRLPDVVNFKNSKTK